jgi:glycosyltransferase involved in cell wall biosynthesis
MTLLHVITRLSLGGSARNTIDSAAAAVRAGYRTILATGPSGTEVDVTGTAHETGTEVVVIPSFRRQVSPIHDLRALVQTTGLIRREHAQIVHTHTSKAGFIGRMAAYLSRAPAIIHTPHGHIFHDYYGRTLTRFFILLERFAAKLSDRIVVLTDRGAEEHLARRIGRPHQYVTIPSGVDIQELRARAPARDPARKRLGWKKDGPYILGIGRFVPVKGFDTALAAMPDVLETLPETRLVLIGDGPEQTALERSARQMGFRDKLTIVDASEPIASYISAADVLVTPSRNEGMGRVIVEAMSLGLPAVATRVGGIPNVIEDGQSGSLVDPENPQALARALIDLLQDPRKRAAFGACGKKRAELFSLPRMESLLLQLYRDVLTEKGIELSSFQNGGEDSPRAGLDR